MGEASRGQLVVHLGSKVSQVPASRCCWTVLEKGTDNSYSTLGLICYKVSFDPAAKRFKKKILTQKLLNANTNMNNKVIPCSCNTNLNSIQHISLKHICMQIHTQKAYGIYTFTGISNGVLNEHSNMYLVATLTIFDNKLKKKKIQRILLCMPVNATLISSLISLVFFFFSHNLLC